MSEQATAHRADPDDPYPMGQSRTHHTLIVPPELAAIAYDLSRHVLVARRKLGPRQWVSVEGEPSRMVLDYYGVEDGGE